MIKLKSLYNEINLIGNITPEMVTELDDKICRTSTEADIELYEMFQKKYKWNSYLPWDEWLKKQNSHILKLIYVDLLRIKQKYNIN